MQIFQCAVARKYTSHAVNVWVYVCVCLQANDNDLICLGVKFDQGLAYATISPSWVASDSKEWPHFMVPKHLLYYGSTWRTIAKPVIKVLFIEMARRI